MMNHGAMLWGAALYNNGGFNLKNYRFGQAYGANGVPLRLVNYTPVTPSRHAAARHPAVPRSPARASISASPATSCASSKRAARSSSSSASRRVDEPPGKPLRRLSERGLGTLNRTDPVFLGSAEDAAARSAARLPRLERSSRRLPLQRLHGLPRRLRERPLADELRLVDASTAIRA